MKYDHYSVYFMQDNIHKRCGLRLINQSLLVFQESTFYIHDNVRQKLWLSEAIHPHCNEHWIKSPSKNFVLRARTTENIHWARRHDSPKRSKIPQEILQKSSKEHLTPKRGNSQKRDNWKRRGKEPQILICNFLTCESCMFVIRKTVITYWYEKGIENPSNDAQKLIL